MGLFSPVKSFLSVVLKDNICKFYYRKLSGKKVVDEKVEKIDLKTSEEETSAILAKFANLGEKRLTTSFLIDSKEQKAILGEVEIKENFVYQEIDKGFTVELPQEIIEKTDEKFGIKFDSHTSLFKVLYFLMKNQHFGETAMFMLKFSDKIAFIVGNQEKVAYANIVSMKDHFEVDLGDEDEMFYEVLKGEIDKFYTEHESDFINSIFIYNDGSLGNEIGYVIFSRIFVKTSLTFVDFVDFINKISIKESVRRR
ncbi:MAG: hypothetical protein IJR18_05055 [Campylobacter sp.]|nr:hypothetical protein [Campylobacter sp.]